MLLHVSIPGTKEKGDAIMDPRNNNRMTLRLYAYDSVAAQSITKDDVISLPSLSFVHLSLDNKIHLLRCPVERLL
jgi:hypothetical protein